MNQVKPLTYKVGNASKVYAEGEKTILFCGFTRRKGLRSKALYRQFKLTRLLLGLIEIYVFNIYTEN